MGWRSGTTREIPSVSILITSKNSGTVGNMVIVYDGSLELFAREKENRSVFVSAVYKTDAFYSSNAPFIHRILSYHLMQ